jgi:hypothetical protein
MLQVRAATEIHASPAAVWRVLTDLPRFRLWNPFIRAARGSTQKGGTVRVLVDGMHFAARITERQEERELRWDGHVVADWLARGDHVFTITRLADGWVRFHQLETFSGVLPWLLRRVLARQARRGFEAMNAALAREAEG